MLVQILVLCYGGIALYTRLASLCSCYVRRLISFPAHVYIYVMDMANSKIYVILEYSNLLFISHFEDEVVQASVFRPPTYCVWSD